MAADGGRPYASFVTIATDGAGDPLLLLSRLSDHTRNLAADLRGSLLVDEARGLANPQTGPRISLIGRIECTEDPAAAGRFLARHPAARRYAGFADFGFFRLTIERGHFVGGFARALWLERCDLVCDGAAAAELSAAEPSILAHMNSDHAGTVDRYAHVLLGRRGSGWRMIAVDPDGFDLYRRGVFARLDFTAAVDGTDSLRQTLMDLAEQARDPAATAG